MRVNALLEDIENHRRKMVELAACSSLSNQQVVEISEQLDRLLNRYYVLTAKK